MTRVGLAVHRTFHSLHTRNFRLFFTGQVISVTGTWMNATASAWLVLSLTNSGLALGLNTALTFLPILLVGAWGGLMADRFDKRRILVGTQTVYAIFALTLFALVASGAAQLWMVYLLSLASGMVTALDNPTRQSFYMELVGERDVTNAVSLNSAAFTGTRIVGPALAGILIAVAHTTALCFLVDGLSYVAVIFALLAMRPDDLHGRDRDRSQRGSVREGLRYVWGSPDLRRPLILMAVVFTFSFNFSVLVPLFAKRTFGGDAATFGLMSALAGLGSFAAALVMANRASSRTAAAPGIRRLAIFALASGAALMLTAFAPSLRLAYASMVPLGLTVLLFIITANSILQLASKPAFRGRVMALYGMVFLGSTPIGSLIAGAVGEQLGARAGFLMGAGAAFAVGGVALWWRARVPAARDHEPDIRSDIGLEAI